MLTRSVDGAEREAELLALGYFLRVFRLPGPNAGIAYQNKRVIYDLLFKAAANATLGIAADPKHLSARIGITAELPTWGSAMSTMSRDVSTSAAEIP
jgi:hypothetical protein